MHKSTKRTLLVLALIAMSASMWGSLLDGPLTQEQTEELARPANVYSNGRRERHEAQHITNARLRRNKRLDFLCLFALGAVVAPFLVQKILSSSLKA